MISKCVLAHNYYEEAGHHCYQSILFEWKWQWSFSMQLQILNCITRAGPKPTLKNSSGTRRYYIDLQLNIIGHQLNYYWSDKVLDISYLYFRGLGRMNVNLFNAGICLAKEGGVLLLYSEAVKDQEDWLFGLSLASHRDLAVKIVQSCRTNCFPQPDILWPLLVLKSKHR